MAMEVRHRIDACSSLTLYHTVINHLIKANFTRVHRLLPFRQEHIDFSAHIPTK